ncbi:hypothetical protein BFG04_03615 [Campylobacter pinnipediorum subsp. pinnipediorum]|uniref:Periplasmic protein n=1 Tax=Campylobacter pinnipediorum subsp. pinnipediorum TaxID=1660067 RepID=A0AAX0LAB8_9BACT|nr:hypothetical protein [Campylobacter pinnipediorum]OPA78016.1 hypothetical protein BFG04_03615 [Campylobacter pinnipediorum subsp. pinnipediorum]
MEYILFIIFGVILIVMLGLIILKDLEANKKFARYEKALEGVIQENFNLKKQISTLSSVKDGEIVDLGALQDSLDSKIELSLNDKIMPIFNSLKNIESTIDEFQNEQQSRIYSLEEKTRDFTKITSPDIQSDEDVIVKLFNEGKSVENIAKDLKIGVGRVEFVLKMHSLV